MMGIPNGCTPYAEDELTCEVNDIEDYNAWLDLFDEMEPGDHE